MFRWGQGADTRWCERGAEKEIVGSCSRFTLWERTTSWSFSVWTVSWKHCVCGERTNWDKMFSRLGSGGGGGGVKGRASRCPVSPFFGDDDSKQTEQFGNCGEQQTVTKSSSSCSAQTLQHFLSYCRTFVSDTWPGHASLLAPGGWWRLFEMLAWTTAIDRLIGNNVKQKCFMSFPVVASCSGLLTSSGAD